MIKCSRNSIPRSEHAYPHEEESEWRARNQRLITDIVNYLNFSEEDDNTEDDGGKGSCVRGDGRNEIYLPCFFEIIKY